MNLPPLPSTDVARDELVPEYRGPTKRSNWVVPGLLLCGDRSSLDKDASLRAILDAGITTIVCLQTRQETAVAVDYKKRSNGIRPGIKFVEQPIPDQEVTDDGLIQDLVARLLERMANGEILYVHCRGGHGRTGTICALLLAGLYNLDAPEAMARIQFYHDTRSQPVFCADGYQALPDGSGCVVLFPSQREQVLRLLGGVSPDGPPDLSRAQSSVYGQGASNYDEQTMQDWQAAAQGAATALNSGKKQQAECGAQELQRAVELFWTAARLRPDFVKGYIGLAMALRLLGEFGEARDALLQGLEHCPDDKPLLKELRALDNNTEQNCAEMEPANETSSAVVGYGASADEKDVVGGHLVTAEVEVSAPAVPAFTWRPVVTNPRFVILVGLPGSGKSTFSEQLVKSDRSWVRLCQDEMEGRDALENALGRVAKDCHSRLLIDRTNVKKNDRKKLLSLAFDPKGAVCVHFDMSADECELRVSKRTDHPTIPYGGGRGAVRSHRKDFEVPTCAEGFEEVLTISDFDEAAHLLTCWGAEPPNVAPVGFFKFPTTPHILDLTKGRILKESDRLLDPADAAIFFDGSTNVIVEEKIDGANLGISLSENWEPLFQNRSHYVSSAFATQWKALDTWWEEHSWAICQLLEPEVEVLFGEWLWARHTVSYTRLPAYFVAFDIYNKRKGRFVSARERDRRLHGLDIPVVPRLADRVFRDRGELEALLTTQSSFGDDTLEGIYLRVDEREAQDGGLWMQRRGKIVRADFVQAIEDDGHWIHKNVERNKLEM